LFALVPGALALAGLGAPGVGHDSRRRRAALRTAAAAADKDEV
jgi:hypothetical protein